MSSLDLQPNLRLMMIQAGVFATNFFVVKHLFISPYLALRNARKKETEGASEEAKAFVLKADELETKIDLRLRKAFESAKTSRQKAEEKAEQEYEKIVSEGKKRSHEHISQVRNEIELALKQERQKLAAESSLLSSFLSSLLVPKGKA